MVQFIVGYLEALFYVLTFVLCMAFLRMTHRR